MRMPPILIGVLAITSLLAVYSFHMGWIPAIAVGLIASGLVGFLTARGQLPIYLLLAGIVLYALAPQLASISIPSASEKTLQMASWSVTPSAVTNGVSLSGSQFIVPLTYNSTSKTVDKDPVVLSFTVTRTDTGTSDASFKVNVEPANKITDPTTGLSYDAIERDSSRNYKIYVGAGTEFQDEQRTYPMKFGTSQQTFNVTIDLNGPAFQYLNDYDSTTGSVTVAGKTYNILFQKTSTVE